MIIVKFVKDYWSQIGFLIIIVVFLFNWIKATKCSLRNDILTIYDSCRNSKQITLYQKQAVHMSYDLYKKLKGNSFVDEIVKIMDSFKVVE